MTTQEISAILHEHAKWLKGEGGKRADLCDAYLRGANLSGAYLRGANLSGADLCDAYLRGADLYDADLRGANLSGADLCDAYLRGADLYDADLRGANLSGSNLIGADLCDAYLRGADLYDADLRGANLSGADLSGADLRGADLRSANLYDADLRSANLYGADLCGADLRSANLYGANLRGARNFKLPIACPDTGSFIGWKKASGYIVKLLIPEDAKRLSATGRKCRCNKAKVLEIQVLDGRQADISEVKSGYDPNFVYIAGKTVQVDNFDDDRWNECSTGIHFFITREEAVDYTW